MKTKAQLRYLVFFGILIALLSTMDCAYAHIPCMCNNSPDQCTCFIQLGDKGLAVKKIITILIEKGYLVKSDKNNEFTPEVKQAVIKLQTDNDLECTGWMDDETLNVLLYDVLPDKTEKYTAKYWEAICYVPTDGGQKYHANPACSDMINPRMISRVNAVCLGIKPCGKNTCTPYATLTYSSLGLKPRILPEEYYIDESHGESISTEGMDMPDTAPPERSLPPTDKESVYIGNKNSHVFHRKTCASVKDMNEKNKKEFYSRDEAIEDGYKPCNRCKP